MRYVLLAEPFLILLLGLLPFEKIKPLIPLIIAAVLYNLFLVFYNLSLYNADLFTFFDLLKTR